eukprot:scaffold63381_cov45-Cyclotella_meneghiniana.AAC.2
MRVSKKKQTKINRMIKRVQEAEGIPNLVNRDRINRERVRTYVDRLDHDGSTQDIQATGDELIAKEDGIIRMALQNPNGIRIRSDERTLQEVAAIQQLQLDVVAFPECNLSTRGQTREVMQTQISATGESVRIVQASARTEIAVSEYQPGGVLTAFIGKITG